jgi:hypothetical protein
MIQVNVNDAIFLFRVMLIYHPLSLSQNQSLGKVDFTYFIIEFQDE